NKPNAQDVFETLAGIAITTGGEFNSYALQSNEEGADLLGLWPGGAEYALGKTAANSQKGLGTEGILKGCASGSVEALWLVDSSPLADWNDKDLARKAL